MNSSDEWQNYVPLRVPVLSLHGAPTLSPETMTALIAPATSLAIITTANVGADPSYCPLLTHLSCTRLPRACVYMLDDKVNHSAHT